MLKKIFVLAVFFVFCSTMVYAAGFEPGSFIRAADKKGNVVEGTMVKYVNNKEITLLDKSGHYFRLPLKDIKRIAGVPGETVMTGGGSKLAVLKVDMVSGETVLGGISSHGIVEIDMGVKGKRNLWVTDSSLYKDVEAVDRGAADAGAAYMKVKLLNGQIINVPVKKEDVYSITFEK